MTEKEEQAYLLGKKNAWLDIINEALLNLTDDPAAMAAQWASERFAAVAALRAICASHGDNEWPDNLHLADVIEKHLGRHLP